MPQLECYQPPGLSTWSFSQHICSHSTTMTTATSCCDRMNPDYNPGANQLQIISFSSQPQSPTGVYSQGQQQAGRFLWQLSPEGQQNSLYSLWFNLPVWSPGKAGCWEKGRDEAILQQHFEWIERREGVQGSNSQRQGSCSTRMSESWTKVTTRNS